MKKTTPQPQLVKSLFTALSLAGRSPDARRLPQESSTAATSTTSAAPVGHGFYFREPRYHSELASPPH